MRIGTRNFDTDNNCYIMGILNVTPDSFSDGGKYNTLDQALFHAEEMIRDGADLIDVGGESTRPGYVQISDEEEESRILPVIEAITSRFDTPVSVDTYKSNVARAAVRAGASLVNDIWGFTYDPNMADVVATEKVACCLMHNRTNTNYQDFVRDMKLDLQNCIRIAKEAGIEDDRIMIDPGVGFAKDYEQNLLAIRHVDELLEFGYPVLLATSRKSVIGLALDLPKEERVEGTMATTAYGYLHGASFVRVHDVKENYRLIQMLRAIRG